MTELGSATLEGARARAVQVECSLIKGLPSFTIVGLGDSSIQESKESVKNHYKPYTLTKNRTRHSIYIL